MKITKHLAIIVEIVGCCITVAGIVTEWVTKADYGNVIITSGALIVAFGSMIFAKCIRSWKDENRE